MKTLYVLLCLTSIRSVVCLWLVKVRQEVLLKATQIVAQSINEYSGEAAGAPVSLVSF